MAEAAADPILSQDQTLGEFQQITGKDDTDECKMILERHSWNIEAAVHSVFSEQEGIPSAYDNIDVTEVQNTSHHLAQNISGPVNTIQRRTSWTEWMLQITMFPYNAAHFGVSFVYHCMSEFFMFVMRIVWPGFGRAITNPIEDVMKFRAEFESLYGGTHPTFYMGSYAQVLSDAKKELKSLLVYLHSPDHQNTPKFCQDVLCNSNFRQYTQTKNMLFWACDVNSNEGYRVSRAMRETTYPFLAIVCIRDGRMTIVWRIEGETELDSLIAICEQVFNDNEASIVAARAERNERLMNREIRNEQDVAFKESLERDKLKRLENQKKLEAQKEDERLQQEKEDQLRQKVEELARKRKECRAKLDSIPEPSPTAVGALQLRVKLPQRSLSRYFLNTDELQIIYDFVLACEDSPGEFQLCSSFPKVIYTLPGNENRTLESLGIKRSTALFVQELSTDSSDEDMDEEI